MIDAWRAMPHGRDAVLQALPTTFNWPLLGVALLPMASPHCTTFGLRHKTTTKG